jgi:deazaflavin-dependent oxidoreductase (nitroreductase family)
MVDVSEAYAKQAHVYADHLARYLASDGEDGYLLDMSGSRPFPGSAATPTLILRTLGRKSGKLFMTPLIYAPWGHEYIVVGSKSGHDEDPSWLLNLRAREEVAFQVRATRFSGIWREVTGASREPLWRYVTTHFPNYAAYQARTARLIPIVILTPQAEVAQRWSLSEQGQLPDTPG